MAWALVCELVRAVVRQPVSMLAKQAAYSLLYAIPSVVIVLVAITAVVDKQTDVDTADLLLELSS